jgi:hypothetical protein
LTRNGYYARLVYDLGAGKDLTYWRGKAVTVGAWVYATQPGTARVRFNSPNISGESSASSAFHPGDGKWHFITVTGHVDMLATGFFIYLENLYVDGDVYFDSVIAQEGNTIQPKTYDFFDDLPVSVRADVDVDDFQNNSLAYVVRQPYHNVITIADYIGNSIPKPMGMPVSIVYI